MVLRTRRSNANQESAREKVFWPVIPAIVLALAGAGQAFAQSANPSTSDAEPADTTPDDSKSKTSKASDDQLEEVVVTGIRASLTEAIDVKRQSMQAVDSIVAEDIGKFPDNNVVEALQRVTGIQVTDRGSGEVATVSIRGLTDVTTTINGRNIFTASGRSVALADVPASLLKRVDVYKTRSASSLETGIAGQIDIHTQRPFDFDGSKFVVAARGIYQEQADKLDPNVSALFSDRWDTGMGQFGALVNISYARTNYRDQSVTAGAMVPFNTENPAPGFTPLERIFPTDARAAEDPIWQAGLVSGLPFAAGSTLNINGVPTEYYLSRDAIFQNDFTGKRERPAANLSLQWAPNDKSEYLFEAFYNGYRNDSFNSLLFSFVDWWGNLGSDPASTISLYPGTNIIKTREVGAPYNFTSGDLTTSNTDSYLYALGGTWHLTDNFKLRSEINYQDSKFHQEFVAMRLDRVANAISVDFNAHNGIPSFAFIDNPATSNVDESDAADPNQWNMAQFYDNGNKRDGSAKTFTLDGDWNVDVPFIKTVTLGVRYDDRNASEAQRTQDAPACDITTAACQTASYPGIISINHGFFDNRSDVPTSWVVPNGYYIKDHIDEFRQLYQTVDPDLKVGDQVQLTQTFNVDEKTSSAYAQADFSTEVINRTLDGEFGARFTSVKTDMDFTDLNTLAESSASAKTHKLLPSLMMRYGITENLRARFAYGETLRRPNFTDLNSTIIYVPDVTNIGYGTATGGNPNLKPTISKNLDLSLEWYFAQSSAVYATVFKRKIDGFVVSLAKRVRFQDYDYILTQPDNASNGELKGAELGFVYFPKSLPRWADGAGIQASYTKLHSSQEIPVTDDVGNLVGTQTTPVFGVSPNSYSVVAAYEKPSFGARLSYVWRDDFVNSYEARLFANPLSIYRKPEKSLDFQLNYNVSKQLVVTFDATNLTNEIYQSYYQYPTTDNFGSSIYSRTFALGLRASF